MPEPAPIAVALPERLGGELGRAGAQGAEQPDRREQTGANDVIGRVDVGEERRVAGVFDNHQLHDTVAAAGDAQVGRQPQRLPHGHHRPAGRQVQCGREFRCWVSWVTGRRWCGVGRARGHDGRQQANEQSYTGDNERNNGETNEARHETDSLVAGYSRAHCAEYSGIWPGSVTRFSRIASSAQQRDSEESRYGESSLKSIVTSVSDMLHCYYGTAEGVQ